VMARSGELQLSSEGGLLQPTAQPEDERIV